MIKKVTKKISSSPEAKPFWVDDLVDKDAFTNFKDQMLTLFDKVMGELKTIREEMTIITGKSSEYSDTFEDHEARIDKLEKTISI